MPLFHFFIEEYEDDIGSLFKHFPIKITLPMLGIPHYATYSESYKDFLDSFFEIIIMYETCSSKPFELWDESTKEKFEEHLKRVFKENFQEATKVAAFIHLLEFFNCYPLQEIFCWRYFDVLEKPYDTFNDYVYSRLPPEMILATKKGAQFLETKRVKELPLPKKIQHLSRKIIFGSEGVAKALANQSN